MHEDLKLRIQLEDARKKILDKKRKCLSPNCNNDAIKNSHVLQRQGILNMLVDRNNKFYTLQLGSLFNKDEGILKLRKVGINEGYIFPGYCKKCDYQVFKEIETHPIKFNRKAKALFAYRSVCNELRRKEVILEVMKVSKDIIQNEFPQRLIYLSLNYL
jgi:hypothetical protein